MLKPEAPLSRDIEPEFFEAVGRIIVRWSAVEALIAEFLSYLIPADPGGMYVLNQTTSVEQQMKWIRALAEIRLTHPNTVERLNDLFARIDGARTDRNAYVHGVWSTLCEPGAVLIQTVRLGRAEMVRSELVTLADLNDLVGQIQEIWSELHSLGKNLGFIP